jgi:hypothetical protein
MNSRTRKGPSDRSRNGNEQADQLPEPNWQACRQSILIDKASIDIAIAKPARIDIDIDTLLRNT